MRLGVALALAGCLALPLAAQSVRGRLEGRIPSAAIPAVDSLIQLAAQEGLPTEPLVQKALEGGAKQVAASRIVAAVQLSLGQLRDARDLLVRAGDRPPVLPAELTTVAWALRRGLPAPVIERVVVALEASLSVMPWLPARLRPGVRGSDRKSSNRRRRNRL